MSLHALVGRSRRTVRSSLLLGLAITIASGGLCYAAYALFFPDSMTSALDMKVPLLVPALLAPLVAVFAFHLSNRITTERIKLDAARKLLRQEAEERRRAEARVEKLIQTDQVTGLANERCFHDRVEQAIARARRNGAPVALMKVRVDRFDAIGQQFGRDNQDLILREVSRACIAGLREVDTPGRIADDMLAVLLEGTVLIHAKNVAERLQQHVENTPIPTPAGNIVVTCSIGIAQVDARHQDAADLFAGASEALNHAQQSGEGQICMRRDDQTVAA